MAVHPDVYIALIALLFNALSTVGVVTWKLRGIEISLRGAIDASRSEVEARQDENTRHIGETITAVQEHIRKVERAAFDKISEVELYSRDNFVRRDGFYKVRDAMAADIKALGETIAARLERMEAKIDTKT